MHIQVESPQFPLTAALSSHLERNLRDELGLFTDRIRNVHAHFADINGRRGGSDKRCRLIVHLSRVRHVVVECTDADLYVAITRCAGRLRRAVGRRIHKRHRVREQRALPGELISARTAEKSDESIQ